VIDENHDQPGAAPKIYVADTVHGRHQARLIAENNAPLGWFRSKEESFSGEKTLSG
jgi:hypothetical protein